MLENFLQFVPLFYGEPGLLCIWLDRPNGTLNLFTDITIDAD